MTEDTQADELCRDIQMKLPDCLWQLDYLARYQAGRYNNDFATTEDGRRFIFGVIEISFTEEPGSFTWGVWAEVPRELHDKHLETFGSESAEGIHGEGRLANDIPGFEAAMGSLVRIELKADRRPVITVLEGDLGDMQARGMSLAEHIELDGILFGDDDDADDEEDFDEEDQR